jgi:hypothetical protein
MYLLFAHAVQEDWPVHSLDFNTAFLNSQIDKLVFARAPVGLRQYTESGEELVWKLKKTLCGLKQAPRAWYFTLREWLLECGFEVSRVEPCTYLFYVHKGGEKQLALILLVYVDDLTIAGPDSALIEKFEKVVGTRFEVTDTGETKWILGIQVQRDWQNGTVKLSQRAYVEQLLKRFDVDECRAVATPAEGSTDPVKDGEPNKEFVQATGWWLSVPVHDKT